LKDIIEWINDQEEYDDYTKNELIKTISKYPQGALPRYRAIIHAQLPRIHRERKKKHAEE
jgi:hypothetical protein